MKSEREYTITEETFDRLYATWSHHSNGLNWDCLFVLPPWLKAWWRCFGGQARPCLCAVRQGEVPIGIAPLMITEERACLMGNPDVCDYLDFIITPGREKDFFNALMPYLKDQGVTRLDLRGQRPGSPALNYLVPIAAQFNYEYSCSPDGMAFAMVLPAQWEDYLLTLSGKQRHEIRRKIRRINEFAPARLRVVEEAGAAREAMDIFLTLFRAGPKNKTEFMNEQRAQFFHDLAVAMAESRMLKLYFLDIEKIPAAAAICFDYQSTTYLYNNGYDRQFQNLNVGLVNKIYTIEKSILMKQQRYDFLKGREIYKQRLGGKPVLLYRCLMTCH